MRRRRNAKADVGTMNRSAGKTEISHITVGFDGNITRLDDGALADMSLGMTLLVGMGQAPLDPHFLCLQTG